MPRNGYFQNHFEVAIIYRWFFYALGEIFHASSPGMQPGIFWEREEIHFKRFLYNTQKKGAKFCVFCPRYS